MAFFEDLSPYTYGQPVRRELVNVGWLEKGHPYVVGETSQEFRDKLARLCEQGGMRRHGQRVVRVSTCGIHRSDLCDSGERSPGSSAEIRVRGTNWAYVARTQSRLCRVVGERTERLGKKKCERGDS
jgi:hypothetical protein